MGVLKDFKYDVGDQIDNLLITNKKRIINNMGRSQKSYNYICKVCTYEGEHTENELNSGRRCPVCAGRKILIGYNDLWTTCPEVAKLLKDPNDAYKYTKGSRKKVDFICPECKKINNKEIAKVVKYNFSCKYCADSISIPEKFMMNILGQIGLDYIYQLTKKTFSWIGKYKYDFYLIKENTIIEVQGMQHLCDTGNVIFTPFEKQVEIDNKKMDLAMKNGITTYIQMDFSNSSYEYLYNSVMNSAFPVLFDIKNVDFKKCYQNSLKSFVVEVCDLWNNGFSVSEIKDKIKLCRGTIYKYLSMGNDIGLCNYSVSESRCRSAKLSYNNGTCYIEKICGKNKHKVYCITTKEYFLSVKEALQKYPNAYHISCCCTNKRKTSGKDEYGNKLEWRYWNEKEIEEYETTNKIPVSEKVD